MESSSSIDNSKISQKQQKINPTKPIKPSPHKQRDNNDSSPAEKKLRYNQDNKNGGVNVNFSKPLVNKGFGGGRNRSRGSQIRGSNQNQASEIKIGAINEGNLKSESGISKQHKQNIFLNHHNKSRNSGGNLVANRDRSRCGRSESAAVSISGCGSGNNSSRSDDFFICQRLRAFSGPTHELPPIEVGKETKFSGRNRLYVGNLTSDITEEELRDIFKPYGEISEIFSNLEKNFTFLKVDFHVNAEKAKRALDGTLRKNRQLRVRFAPNATILRVRNLTPFVSNELLYKSFEIFGPLERASIIVDERGKHTGEGVVEFAKKSSATTCLRFCSEKCFFLTASLRPCLVEPYEINDDNDGLPEKSLNRKTQEFNHERNIGPRFAEPGSFEHEYGTRWKQLHELFKSKHIALKRELKMEEEKLEAQMEYARYEHETELLRQELRKRESDNERKKMEWELREKHAEEMRKRDEENVRRQQSEMQSRMMRQEEEMRRRQQENTLFMQAQQLNSLLDQQENFCGGPSNFDSFENSSPFEVFRGNNSSNTGGNSILTKQQQDSFAFDFGGNNSNQSTQVGTQRGANNVNNNPWERRRRF